jgi:hypothetical protein
MENGNSPATKQDVIDAVNASEARLTKLMHDSIQKSEDRLTGMLKSTEDRLTGMLKSTEDRLTGMLKSTEDRLIDMIKASEDRVVEKMRDMQTEMLKAFYSLIESNQKRFAEIENESAAIKSRLVTIEDRLLVLERKVNIPNPPSAPLS